MHEKEKNEVNDSKGVYALSTGLSDVLELCMHCDMTRGFGGPGNCLVAYQHRDPGPALEQKGTFPDSYSKFRFAILQALDVDVFKR